MRINNGSNYGRYSNPAYDRLLDQASNEPDIAKRGVLMAQAEKLLLDDVGIVPMFFWVSPVITQTYVKGWKPNVRDKHLSRWISIER